MIPDETIERIRDSADIVGIIGEYVELKRQGTDFRGPCPFHQGTKRNFSVSPKKQMYHCFVCNESGDVFKFITKRLGLDWPSAVRLVGEKTGIEVVETNSRKPDEKDDREPLWEANGAAAEYFRRMLWEEEAGAKARAYLEQRSVSRELAERVGLGFAPREVGVMRAFLNTLGFPDDRMIDAGLLVETEGGEPRPRFRDRLIFPIYDLSNRVSGFGGRLLGPGEPKYLNSPESRIFSKGKMLYALNWAKLAARRDERMLVVEGYFDAMRLIGAGIESVVAPMGTALTEEQAALIRRYTNRVYLLYDSDKAGLKATFRSGDELLRQGAAVQVVTLPDGDDPDSFVQANGVRGVEAQLATSVDVFERKIQILERGGWFGDLRKKRQALDRLLPTLRATADPLTRDLYLNHAALAANVSRELLEREMTMPARSRSGRSARTSSPVQVEINRVSERGSERVRSGDRRRTVGERGNNAERALLRMLVHFPAQFEKVMERVGPGDFRDPDARDIFVAMLEHGADAGADVIAERLEPDAIALLQDLLAESGGLDRVEETVAGCLAKIHERGMIERLEEIDREMPLASEPQKDTLTSEKRELTAELRRLGGQYWKKFR